MGMLLEFASFAIVAFALLAMLGLLVWVGATRTPIENILNGYDRVRGIYRFFLVLGYIAGIVASLCMWNLHNNGLTEPLTGWLIFMVLLSGFFVFTWVGLGTKKITLLSHLVLDVWLHRKYMRREGVDVSEIAALIRMRVAERAWLHRVLFRMRKLDVNEVVNRICVSDKDNVRQ